MTSTSTAAWRLPGLVLVLSPAGAVLVLEGNATGPEYEYDDEHESDRVAYAGGGIYQRTARRAGPWTRRTSQRCSATHS